MTNTPLNPDAIKAARLVYGGLTECEAASDCDECQVEAGEIIRAYLAVAQSELQANSKPKQNFEVVNSVEELAKAWHAGFCKGEQTAFRERPVNPDTINPYKNGEKP